MGVVRETGRGRDKGNNTAEGPGVQVNGEIKSRRSRRLGRQIPCGMQYYDIWNDGR